MEHVVDQGHCVGLAVMSLSTFQKKLNPLDFGGAVTPALPLVGNALCPTPHRSIVCTRIPARVQKATIMKSPNETLDILIREFRRGRATTTPPASSRRRKRRA